jgi:hypothetical protein
MLNWLEGVAGPQFATAALWTLAALILLVVVLVIVRLIRSLTFGTFVAGGRNRKTRLAVMDAAAVDSHRRLVLVRRDDVEHLIMIGGPTDVVVERDIRLGQPRRAALTGGEPPELSRARPENLAPPQQAFPVQQQLPVQQQIAMQQARPQAQPQRAPAAPRPVVREQAPREQVQREQAQPRPQQPQRPAQPAAPAAGAAAYMPQGRSAPSRPASPPQAHAQPRMDHRADNKAPARNGNTLDDTLLRELEVSFDTPPPPPPARNAARPRELSVDDEMTKLLGELSSPKR